jgi:hypothetical protein
MAGGDLSVAPIDSDITDKFKISRVAIITGKVISKLNRIAVFVAPAIVI